MHYSATICSFYWMLSSCLSATVSANLTGCVVGCSSTWREGDHDTRPNCLCRMGTAATLGVGDTDMLPSVSVTAGWSTNDSLFLLDTRDASLLVALLVVSLLIGVYVLISPVQP
mmetsp:Transcript_49760/g.124802  ORF Transcript_49760/g.124802 Transcript_49760/m.124802 type:complete len:114 (-) Transcript_49760:1450-1791(-)